MADLKARIQIINVAVFIILEAAALTILGMSDSIQSAWIGRGMTNIAGGLWGSAERVHGYFNLREKNDSLASANVRLYNQLVNSREQFARNTAPQWMRIRTDFQIQKASVVTMTRGSQHNYMILDRGSVDGVRPDDGVITDRGVVGIVQSVTERYSRVITFENQGMVLGTKVGHDGAVGATRWTGHSDHSATMSDVPIHAPVEIGDTIYTSGYSTIFPSDIPVGVVLSRSVENGSSAELKVAMFENYRQIHSVCVVRNNNASEIKSLSK